MPRSAGTSRCASRVHPANASVCSLPPPYSRQDWPATSVHPGLDQPGHAAFGTLRLPAPTAPPGTPNGHLQKSRQFGGRWGTAHHSRPLAPCERQTRWTPESLSRKGTGARTSDVATSRVSLRRCNVRLVLVPVCWKSPERVFIQPSEHSGRIRRFWWSLTCESAAQHSVRPQRLMSPLMPAWFTATMTGEPWPAWRARRAPRGPWALTPEPGLIVWAAALTTAVPWGRARSTRAGSFGSGCRPAPAAHNGGQRCIRACTE